MPAFPNPSTHLIIKGASQHNLKSVNLVIPKNQLIVFTGLSGSGKSSLAFDTIYAEGQRRYVESLSSYARQFLGLMSKPEVESIDGLSPAISIDQKTTSHNPRSTVGTITEIYDYLRLLFARIGHPHCPQCQSEITPQTADQISHTIIDKIVSAASTSPITRWLILSPIVQDKKGEFTSLFHNLSQKGFSRVRIDGRIYNLNDDFLLIKTNRHSVCVVLDRITFDNRSLSQPSKIKELESRLRQVVEQSLDLSQGLIICSQVLDKSLTFPENPTNYLDSLYSQRFACPICNRSFSEVEPRLFSFNTPHGACPTCTGLGVLLKVDPVKIIAPELTITEGAIIPLANALSTDSWYSRKLTALFIANHIPLKTPFSKLPPTFINILLYGSPLWLKVSGSNRDGREASFSFQWEGVVKELERRFKETQSEYIRGEIARFMRKEICPDCRGDRLKPESLSVTIRNKNIAAFVKMSIDHLHQFIQDLQSSTSAYAPLSDMEKQISQGILKEIHNRTEFLLSVGLDYLTLSREASTLAGGEAQRIRLASQIGTGLTGVLYVLDEPTIGLHPRDNERLIQTLISLKDLGNTIIVVEHDREVILASDYMVDFGPGAGLHGGEVVAAGVINEVLASPNSLTAKYLSGEKSINYSVLSRLTKKLHPSLTIGRTTNLPPETGTLTLVGARENNLKNISVSFPLSKMIVISGVSGSGKSTLMHDTLFYALKKSLNLKVDKLIDYDRLDGYEVITKVLMIDQSPIGRTPRSNPVTYIKAFDIIREIFSQTKEAKVKGYKAGRFSFNVKGGRCEACQGGGEVKISMQFLADIYVTCDVCRGQRYNSETLDVRYQNLTINDVLNLTVEQALKLFHNHHKLIKHLATLQAVGLGYLKLGQPAPTLSGGEAQRIKLAKELSISAPGHTVYLLDEPTTGLHFEDVKNLLVVLKQLAANNNTVILIEHNLDVIKNADWIIDLGPGGGEKGGLVTAVGSPQEIALNPHSVTGRYLKS